MTCGKHWKCMILLNLQWLCEAQAIIVHVILQIS